MIALIKATPWQLNLLLALGILINLVLGIPVVIHGGLVVRILGGSIFFSLGIMLVKLYVSGVKRFNAIRKARTTQDENPSSPTEEGENPIMLKRYLAIAAATVAYTLMITPLAFVLGFAWYYVAVAVCIYLVFLVAYSMLLEKTAKLRSLTACSG